MKITLVERQSARVAALRYTGPRGAPLARFWRATVGPLLAEHGLLDCPRYGVMLDDPGATLPDRCHYDACVEIPAGLTLPDAVEATIPGGRHAVTHFKGTAAEIGAAWTQFVGAALADCTTRRDAGRRPYEHYPRGAVFDSRTGMFDCELCLPVSS
ncbi:MAG TPA: GyrI-like domain-containing protein [Steroidobacteraceae bacterium]|nr:GyrI-like domain-containing protein [Steroidobacteraceae bacterium]